MKAPLTASTSPGSSSPSSVARYWLSAPEAPSARPIPVKWASALSGVGKERLQAWSSSPDSSTSFTPTMPIRGSERSRASAASSVPA